MFDLFLCTIVPSFVGMDLFKVNCYIHNEPIFLVFVGLRVIFGRILKMLKVKSRDCSSTTTKAFNINCKTKEK